MVRFAAGQVTVVNACLRDGRGGSPTAVVDDTDPGALTDAERRRVPARYGTSHAAFLTRPDPAEVRLRFFTTEGELPACGHGTVAAIAFLAARRGLPRQEFRLQVAGRAFTAHATRDGDLFHTAFDPGHIAVRDATAFGKLVETAKGAA